jgi:hypothetical protein
MMTDRDEIANLLSRYCLLVDDAGKEEEWAALFAEDAIFTVLDVRLRGRSIVQFMIDTRSFDSGKHITLNPAIEVSGDTATATSDFLYIGKGADGQYSFATDPPPHFGRYFDRLAKVDGTWRFAERSVQVYNEPLIRQIIAEKTRASRAAAQSATPAG